MGNDRGIIGFVSYASVNLTLAEEFLRLLKPRAKTHRKLDLETWWDQEIPIGVKWNQEIHDRMDAAAVAIMLLSPEFHDSGFIATYEVPHFMEQAKPVILPMLVPYDPNEVDAGGLDGLQVYRYRPPGTSLKLSFQECDETQRGLFVNEVVAAIAARLAWPENETGARS